MSGISHGNGACQAIHAQLDAYLSNELPPETRKQVGQHLEACAQCAAELAARTGVKSQLRAAVRATPTPPGLEARVQLAVRGQAARPRTGLWAVAAAAAVIACVFLVSLLRTRTSPEEAILRKTTGHFAAVLKVGLRDHLNCAVFRKYPKTPEPASRMAVDLGPGFAALAPLVQAKLPANFRIIQAHHCSAGGRQFTHFIIYGDGKLVSLTLTRKLPNEALSGGIYQSGVDRFQVVGFETNDYLAFVISDLDAGQNLRLAASLAPTLREFLADHWNDT